MAEAMIEGRAQNEVEEVENTATEEEVAEVVAEAKAAASTEEV
jgi:hypothetical protein